jgi:hypothetical protein
MARKPKLDDRIRALVKEIYAECVSEGALPVAGVTFLRDLLYRGLEGKHWPRALRIIGEEVPAKDRSWSTPEEIKKWLPDPQTKMLSCSSCDGDIAVPLDYKIPLGMHWDFYCRRPECVAHRKEHEAYCAEIDRRCAAGEPLYDVPIAPIEPEDPRSAEVKRIQKEWGVEKIKAIRGRKLAALPPIEPEIKRPQRLQHKLTRRQVAALLDIRGFSDVFTLDEIHLYRDYASGNYSQRQLEARVIGKKYPTIHIENFLDNLILLENAIVIRGLALNRITPRVQTGMEEGAPRDENKPRKRNAVPLGMGSHRHEESPGVAEQDFGAIEVHEIEKTERRFPIKASAKVVFP